MFNVANILKAAENPELALKQAAEAAKAEKPDQPAKEETWRDRAIKEPVFW